MSRNLIVFAVLFSLVLSIALAQDASALTRGAGQYSRTTASLDPSRVCGDHVCNPGENSKWSLAVHSSQREGPGKATGAQHGNIIMHQMVVNAWSKAEPVKQAPMEPKAEPKMHEKPSKMPKMMPIKPAMNSTMQTSPNDTSTSSTMQNSTNGTSPSGQ